MRPSSPQDEGRSRSSRMRGGMRWTPMPRLTSVAEGYGEVVWFWRRGAGVKSFGKRKLHGGDGGKRAVLREEHEVSRKAIAQGRPGMLPPNLYARVHLLLCASSTRDRGCGAHPVFPAPSDFEGKEVSGKARAHRVAGMRSYFNVIASEAKQSIARRKERMDCFAALAMTWIGRGVLDRPPSRAMTATHAPSFAAPLRNAPARRTDRSHARTCHRAS